MARLSEDELIRVKNSLKKLVPDPIGRNNLLLYLEYLEGLALEAKDKPLYLNHEYLTEGHLGAYLTSDASTIYFITAPEIFNQSNAPIVDIESFPIGALISFVRPESSTSPMYVRFYMDSILIPQSIIDFQLPNISSYNGSYEVVVGLPHDLFSMTFTYVIHPVYENLALYLVDYQSTTTVQNAATADGIGGGGGSGGGGLP